MNDVSDPTSPSPVEMTHDEAVRTLASERYLLDEMSEPERERFEAHYFQCIACGQDLRMTSLVREQARAGGLATPSPAATVLRPARWSSLHPSVVVPWAVAASLALVVGYQSFRTPLPPAEALQVVALRGQTRSAEGAVPVVSMAEGQRAVALSADAFVEPATRQLSFELLGPSGDALTSGRVPVPSPGESLMLLVRADAFSRSGRHTLVVRDGDRPDVIVGEYPFDVTTSSLQR